MGDKQREWRIESRNRQKHMWTLGQKWHYKTLEEKNGLTDLWLWGQIKLDSKPISDTKINYRFIKDLKNSKTLQLSENIGSYSNDFKWTALHNLRRGCHALFCSRGRHSHRTQVIKKPWSCRSGSPDQDRERFLKEDKIKAKSNKFDIEIRNVGNIRGETGI